AVRDHARAALPLSSRVARRRSGRVGQPLPQSPGVRRLQPARHPAHAPHHHPRRQAVLPARGVTPALRRGTPAVPLPWAAGAPAAAQPAEAFFKGKTINLYIGFAPGGTYDYYSRLFARFIGRHIPGNPAVVAQNMPGAGSFLAANFLYAVAPK